MVAAWVLLASCGARTLEATDAASKISAKIAEQQPSLKGLAVTCPTDVKVEAGATFNCTFSAEGGVSGELSVTQTDDAGTLSIRYPAPPGTGPPATGNGPGGNGPGGNGPGGSSLAPATRPGTVPGQCGHTEAGSDVAPGSSVTAGHPEDSWTDPTLGGDAGATSAPVTSSDPGAC